MCIPDDAAEGGTPIEFMVILVQTTGALCISICRHDSLVHRTSGSNNECGILNSNDDDRFLGECEVYLTTYFNLRRR